MKEDARLVHQLLTYIEQVEKLKDKPTFIVPSDHFVSYQGEMSTLPELRFNAQEEDDDVWLRVPRLHEIAPPPLEPELNGWVKLPKSPSALPEILDESARITDGEVWMEKVADRPDIQELFDWYVELQWKPWASAEGPRRKTMGLYKRLFSIHQTMASAGSETPLELVWGIGNAAWRKPGHSTPVRYPLILQLCEVTLNESTFGLEVRPRDTAPRLELDCYAAMEVPGVSQLEAHWKAHLDAIVERPNPFEPSSYEGLLTAAVTYLDAGGSYQARADDLTEPTPRDALQITNTWVLFARARSGDIFVEDVRRLKANVEKLDTLPGVVSAFVLHGSSDVKPHASRPFRGLSNSDSVGGGFELYFPMPYNDEQVSIVQKLDANNGVVVQGPPGTGKTHTIANVICHYLAQGKRVLVTAKSETALAVLQEKLPDEIRPLSVALLSDEREGMRQFEHSIETIAATVASLNDSRARSNIATAETKLNELHARISQVDAQAANFARSHMQTYTFQGRKVTPEEMAKLVMEQGDEHRWFDDDLPAAGEALPFDEGAIGVLRNARIKVGASLPYLNGSLPQATAFPAWRDLLGVHRDLVKAQDIDADVQDGSLLGLVDSTAETFEKARSLDELLKARTELLVPLADAPPWALTAGARLAALPQDDPVGRAVSDIIQQAVRMEAERRTLLAQSITLPPDAQLNEDFMDAMERLLAGKTAFALPFGRRDARMMISAVRLVDAAPSDVAGWRTVAQLVRWRVETKRLLIRWNTVAGEFGLGTAPAELETGARQLAVWSNALVNARKLTSEFEAPLSHLIATVFGLAVTNEYAASKPETLRRVEDALAAHLVRGKLAYARGKVDALLALLQGHNGEIVGALESFFRRLGVSEEGTLENEWRQVQEALRLLNSLQPNFDCIRQVTAAIESAGAPRWSARLRAEVANGDVDPHTPSTWNAAWSWRHAFLFLERIDGHDRMRKLFKERKQLTTALARTYRELVAERTWLGVYMNSPESIRQALQAYLNAVQAMGSGKGVRAIRHRKTAREAMLRAYQAVPCWVLPQWRVSETLPAEVGLFDLVVIDEASQSDIWALPALLRGKKLLVVGDDKQVSPSAVGMAEEKIKDISRRFLAEQPFGSHMTPDASIYDLARVVFAGNSVMLKEHFRCVPAIIEFSNREFYKGDIRPLRLAKATERLDPPLIDVYVKGGFRKGDINEPEALAIVNEIDAILANPDLAKRTIGVVTLLGSAQAKFIHNLVHARISPVDIIGRKIAVGPPPVFQGRERDIMLVSMVLAPGSKAAASRAEIEQRFNVALSRARDRVYLFRSTNEADYGPDTLNAKLIRHFRQPFTQDIRMVQDLREKCESGFECEMFDSIVQRGYRVEPQVRCGGYRIDFVVEGSEGRRLAIECDGDQFHGPGQWSDDMVRQRVLERAGWTFWRCFASSFARRKEEVLADLWATLNGLGIEPLGSEAVDNTAWTLSKTADPLGVDEASDEEAEEAKDGMESVDDTDAEEVQV